MGEGSREVWEFPGLDITADGRVTITDLWIWIGYLLFLPGDVLLALLVMRAPAAASFFEIGPDIYGGLFSKFVSITVWLALFVAINAVRNFDRALTGYISSRYDATERHVRLTRRRVASWIGLRRHKHRSKVSSLHVTNIELDELEEAVLKCYADLGDLRVLTTGDVAATLEVSPRQVQRVLRTLMQLHLIQPSFGTDEGCDGHCITKAGQLYLVER